MPKQPEDERGLITNLADDSENPQDMLSGDTYDRKGLIVSIKAFIDRYFIGEVPKKPLLHKKPASAIRHKSFAIERKSRITGFNDHDIDDNLLCKKANISEEDYCNWDTGFSDEDLSDSADDKREREPDPGAPSDHSESQDSLEIPVAVGHSFQSPSPRKLNELMSQLEESFSQRLLRLMKEKGLNEAETYKKAYIDRRHFSKIKNDVNYTPNKKTVLAFSIAMELSEDETRDLLKSAGFALSMSSKFDVIILYFLKNHIYDMFEINDALYEFDQPIFE